MKPIPLRNLTDRMVRALSYAYDWDISKPIAEQWPWKLWREPERRKRNDEADVEAVADIAGRAIESRAEYDARTGTNRHTVPSLTPAETADVIAQSSDSYEPRTTEWEVDGPVRGTADAFAEEDTAAKEPWRSSDETQDSDVTCCARPK